MGGAGIKKCVGQAAHRVVVIRAARLIQQVRQEVNVDRTHWMRRTLRISRRNCVPASGFWLAFTFALSHADLVAPLPRQHIKGPLAPARLHSVSTDCSALVASAQLESLS